MIESHKRDATRAALIHQTAEILGCSERYVRYVLEEQRECETVRSVYMTLLEGQNTLIQQVKQLVPFLHETTRKNS